MKLYYYRHGHGITNFGDDFNPWLWGQVLGELFNDDDSVTVLGAGTLLNHRLDQRIPPHAMKIVLGSGVGYGSPPLVSKRPDLWKIYWVRGPLSADALGSDRSLAISDPGMLIANHIELAGITSHGTAFMPHIATMLDGADPVSDLCEELGLHLIDPRGPVQDVARRIAASDLLFTEALHGSVVADALRIPWVAIKSTPSLLTFKWEDWCKSIDVEYRPLQLPAIWNEMTVQTRLKRMLRSVKYRYITNRLRRYLARAKPVLSREARHREVIERMQHQCDRFKADIGRGMYSTRERPRASG